MKEMRELEEAKVVCLERNDSGHPCCAHYLGWNMTSKIQTDIDI